jgi:hypothetical protein
MAKAVLRPVAGIKLIEQRLKDASRSEMLIMRAWPFPMRL